MRLRLIPALALRSSSGFSSDGEEAFGPSVFLHGGEANAASGDLTGFHFDFGKGEARLELVADETMLLSPS
jgi:hypothetical protein